LYRRLGGLQSWSGRRLEEKSFANNNNNNKFSSLFLCAAPTVKRPITDTAQNIHLRSYNHYYCYNNKFCYYYYCHNN
jgi:hypothetical protein